MWRLAVAVAVAGVVALAGCGSAGADRDAGNSEPITAGPGTPVQAVAGALAFAAHSDPEVVVVDGYVTLPSAVQRGEQPIDLAGGDANPCAQPPGQPFTSSEHAAIRAAFHGRRVSFVGDPAAGLREREPGALVLAATRPLLGDQRGTVMVISCVPDPQQVLVKMHWDGHAWQATATGASNG
jgi:hypothetical protein